MPYRAQERLDLLAGAAGVLLQNRDIATVLPAILDLSERLISADAYAVWRLFSNEAEWRVVAERNLSAEYARVAPDPGRSALPDEPLFIEDVLSHPVATARREAYEAEGIRSMLTVPLRINGELAGTIVFYFRTPRTKDEVEPRLAAALSSLAGAALTNAELFAEQKRQQALLKAARDRSERAQRRLQFLAEASTVLSSSLDYEQTLEHAARLAVPHLADWCTIHVVEESGEVRQVALAHVDPDRIRWARELSRRYPYDPNAARGLANVLRTGESELYPLITEEMLAASARDAEHLEILREVGFTAVIMAPLRVRERILGALTFVSAESGKQYDGEDLLLAEDLAGRAAAAIENARLYRSAQVAVEASERAAVATREYSLRLEVAQIAGRIGTFDWNLQTHEVHWTPELESLYGLKPGTFSRDYAGWSSLIHPEDREEVETAVRRAIEERSDLDTRFRIVTPAGEVRWMAARGRTFYDAHGEPVRVLGINIDVTERMQFEEALERQAHELLEQDRRKNEFLAMLAHELRNPLAPIVTAAEVMRLRAGSDATLLERNRDAIERNAEQLSRIVDDLLEVSRINEGKISLERKPIDLRSVVEQAVAAARPQIEQRRHDLSVSVPLEPLYLKADGTRLVQVLTNLLHNAAKYTEPGGNISLLALRDRDEAVITVRDNGRGIGPELLPRIWELFVQGQQSLQRPDGGLGIGLTLVHRLVALHGGTVEAQSAGVGQGSEFTVRLPAEAPRRSRPKKAPLKGPVPAAGSLRILLVEDNIDAAESTAELLDLWGHEVRVVHDGPMALQLLPEYCPDLILLDIGLPGMDGYQIAQKIRESSLAERVRVVGFSGYSDDAARRRAQESGFDDFLTKPVNPAKLQGFLAQQPRAR